MSEKPDNCEWIFIFGTPIHRIEFYKLLAFALLGGVTLLGVVGYIAWGIASPKSAGEAALVEAAQAQAVGRVSAEPVAPLEQFFAQHFAATRYNEIESIRATGIYIASTVQMKIVFLAKNPHFYKQTVRYKQTSVEAGYDGSQFWYAQTHPVLDTKDPSLNAMNRALTMMECAIPCLTWEYEKGTEAQANFQLMPDEVWNGRPCRVLKNYGLLESPVYHYLDSGTGLELYRRSSVAVDERHRKDVELFYLPPLADSTYALPGGFELYVDGVLYCTAQFDQIEINRGLPDFLFRQTSSKIERK